MGVEFRFVVRVGFAALVFAGGWAGSSVAGAGRGIRAARAEAPETPVVAPPEGVACTDRAAMEANANLVSQLIDSQKRLADAERAGREPGARPGTNAPAPPAGILVDRGEWSRMAREGMLRVRTPCASWKSPSSFQMRAGLVRAPTYGVGRASAEGEERAQAAGLTTEELDALDEAYTRTSALVWAKMKSACEANEGFREATADIEVDDPQSRIAQCRASLLGPDEETESAMRSVAEARAAGASLRASATDHERVLHALTGSTGDLFDEMVRVLGREKATRAVDYGLMCTDEAVYVAPAHGTDG